MVLAEGYKSPMKLQRIAIQNFRSIRDADVDIHDHVTVCLGRNGVGKSTALHALRIFFEPGYSVTDDDFFDRNTEAEILIQVTFTGLTDREVKEFGSHVDGRQLQVIKTYTSGDRRGSYHGWAMQIPEFVKVRLAFQKKDLDKPGVKNEFKALAAIEKFNGLGTTAASSDAAFAAMEKFEAEHPGLCAPTRKSNQFLGAVGGGSLDNFTKFVFVPAVRDANEEVGGKGGVIQQLIQTVVARRIEGRDDVKSLKQEFTDKVQKVYNAGNLTELPDLAKDISALLMGYAPGAELNMRFEDPKVPELRLPGVISTLIEDGFGGSIGNKGHGLQPGPNVIAKTVGSFLTPLGPEGQITQPDPAYYGIVGWDQSYDAIFDGMNSWPGHSKLLVSGQMGTPFSTSRVPLATVPPSWEPPAQRPLAAIVPAWAPLDPDPSYDPNARSVQLGIQLGRPAYTDSAIDHGETSSAIQTSPYSDTYVAQCTLSHDSEPGTARIIKHTEGEIGRNALDLNHGHDIIDEFGLKLGIGHFWATIPYVDVTGFRNINLVKCDPDITSTGSTFTFTISADFRNETGEMPALDPDGDYVHFRANGIDFTRTRAQYLAEQQDTTAGENEITILSQRLVQGGINAGNCQQLQLDVHVGNNVSVGLLNVDVMLGSVKAFVYTDEQYQESIETNGAYRMKAALIVQSLVPLGSHRFGSIHFHEAMTRLDKKTHDPVPGWYWAVTDFIGPNNPNFIIFATSGNINGITYHLTNCTQVNEHIYDSFQWLVDAINFSDALITGVNPHYRTADLFNWTYGRYGLDATQLANGCYWQTPAITSVGDFVVTGTMDVQLNTSTYTTGLIPTQITLCQVQLLDCPREFLPKGGADKNTVKIKAQLYPPIQTGTFRFTLMDVSTEPGYCMNAPFPIPTSGENSPDWLDLQFLSQPQFNSPLSPAIIESSIDQDSSQVTVQSYDYGAFGKMKVEFRPYGHSEYIDGVRKPIASIEADTANILIPYEFDGAGAVLNQVADGFEDSIGLAPGTLPGTWDEERHPASAHKGDGLSLYEEYRGFMIKGYHTRTNGAGDQDIFYCDMTNGQLLTAHLKYINKLGLQTHWINASEWDGVNDMEQGLANHQSINFNRKSNQPLYRELYSSSFDQRAIRVVNLADHLDYLGPGQGTALGVTEHRGNGLGFNPGVNTSPNRCTFLGLSFNRIRVVYGSRGDDGIALTFLHESAHACNVEHNNGRDYNGTQINNGSGFVMDLSVDPGNPGPTDIPFVPLGRGSLEQVKAWSDIRDDP